MLPNWSPSPSRDVFSDSYSSWAPFLGEEWRWWYNVHVTESKRRNGICTSLVFAALDRRSPRHWNSLVFRKLSKHGGSNPAAAEAKCDHAPPENWCEVWFCNFKTKKLDLVQIFVGLFQIFRGFFPPLHDEHFGLIKKSQPSWCCLEQWTTFSNCFEYCAHRPLVSTPAERSLPKAGAFSSQRTVFVRNAAT